MESRLVIELHDLPQHEGSWTFPLTRAWAAAAFEGCDVAPLDEEGTLEVSVSATGSDFLVQGRVRLAVAAACVRCLHQTRVTIDVPVAVLFVPGPVVVKERGTDEEAEPDEGPDVEHYQGSRLVLDAYVRDTILLELPMNPRCAVECTLPARPQGES